jgi:dsRNA-specific ribonuclease
MTSLAEYTTAFQRNTKQRPHYDIISFTQVDEDYVLTVTLPAQAACPSRLLSLKRSVHGTSETQARDSLETDMLAHLRERYPLNIVKPAVDVPAAMLRLFGYTVVTRKARVEFARALTSARALTPEQKKSECNELLAFRGDAVLRSGLTAMLTYHMVGEREIASETTSLLQSNKYLARRGRDLGLHNLISVGPKNIATDDEVATAMEAILAAVFRDADSMLYGNPQGVHKLLGVIYHSEYRPMTGNN